MPIKTDSLVFIGTQDVLTCCYSKGRNIVRKSTSLNAARVKKDPAFKGFRKSCGRMKKASPIAASLYAMIPPKHRQYPLYRVLTGAAIRLIKEGMAVDIIKTTLKKEHIDPLIAGFLTARRALVAPRPAGSSLFSYGELSDSMPVRKHARLRSGRSGNRTAAALSLNARKANVRFIPGVERVRQKERTDPHYVPGLVYLGRLEDAPKLKMYQRADAGLILGLNADPAKLKFPERP